MTQTEMARLLVSVDEQFWNKFPETRGRKLTQEPSDRRYRTAWLDLFSQMGGSLSIVFGDPGVGVRAQLPLANEAAARAADEQLWAAHPELGRRLLTNRFDDAALRAEWMDLYQSLGGEVVEARDGRLAKPAL